MGKIQIITAEQTRILDLVSSNRYLNRSFYFTGGTALSEFYLAHRFSEDLDFFSEKAIDQELILTLMTSWSQKLGFRFSSRFVEVVYRFDLHFSNGSNFKVDFAHYPHTRIEKGNTSYKTLPVDSLRDIATNKLFTVNQRTDVKDFVDLYFLLAKHFTIWDLFDSADVKFTQVIFDRYLTAQDFLRIEDFTTLPRMIKPVTLDDLKDFYRSLAKKLAKQVVE